MVLSRSLIAGHDKSSSYIATVQFNGYGQLDVGPTDLIMEYEGIDAAYRVFLGVNSYWLLVDQTKC